MSLAVLVIDDEETIRSVAVALLQIEGFAATAAESATDALAWLAANPAGAVVILLDQTMPGPSPMEAVRLLRAACPSATVLIASGSPPSDDVLAAADGSVPKPYTRATLAAAVRAAAS